MRKIYVFIRRKFRVYLKKWILKKENELLKNTNFVIIADNCWGSAIYQWYKRPYNSPFIGMAIYGECYMKLLSNFDYYMSQELKFINKSKYSYQKLDCPLGVLDDVEIRFTHFKTTEEAANKWKRRTKRMLEETNKDNYYFKMCDAKMANKELFIKFHNLPFKNKISFVQNDKKQLDYESHIGIIERNEVNKTLVPNGVKLFKISFLYFDLTNWLLNKKVIRTKFKS